MAKKIAKAREVLRGLLQGAAGLLNGGAEGSREGTRRGAVSRVVAGALVLVAVCAALAGCTSTQYMGIVTPHNAAEVLKDNVQVFEAASYDAAIVMAGEAGYEVILSYEGRNLAFMGITGKVRVIAKDADGIRPGR